MTDLADAHLLALNSLEEGASSTAYNLGNGQGFSVNQVIDMACRVTGREIPVKTGARRAGDPPQLVGDAARAIRALGWSPRFAALEDIIETAWKWHLRNA